MAAVNASPTGSVSISGTPAKGQTLTASNTLADADGLGTISYQWKAAGVDIAGATASSYVLTQSEVGKTITVVASYVDGLGTAESVSSGATAAVAAVNASPTGAVTISDTPAKGLSLSTPEPATVTERAAPVAKGGAINPVTEVLGVGATNAAPSFADRPNIAIDMVVLTGIPSRLAVTETPTIPSSKADAVLAQALTEQFNQVTLQPLSALFQNTEFLSQFDEMKRQMSLLGTQRHALVASSVALSSGLSIGYVIWLVRGGVLMSSMLSALPAWQMIDPLPVLAAAKSKKRKADISDPPEEQSAERLFDRKVAPLDATESRPAEVPTPRVAVPHMGPP